MITLAGKDTYVEKLVFLFGSAWSPLGSFFTGGFRILVVIVLTAVLDELVLNVSDIASFLSLKAPILGFG